MSRWFGLRKSHDRAMQPVATPTALSLLLVSGLLVGLLVMPQKQTDRHAGAAEVTPPPLSEAGPGRPISLRDRLIVGLQARLKTEIAFVHVVVAAVNNGILPQRLVDETFFWARERAQPRLRYARQRRPIIYFQPAMIARAARVGVAL